MPICGCPDKVQEDGTTFSCACVECCSGQFTSCSCNKSTGCSCMSKSCKDAGISSGCHCAAGTCTCPSCPCDAERKEASIAGEAKGCCGGK